MADVPDDVDVLIGQDQGLGPIWIEGPVHLTTLAWPQRIEPNGNRLPAGTPVFVIGDGEA